MLPWHQYLLGLLFVIAGFLHFQKPKIYLKIINFLANLYMNEINEKQNLNIDFNNNVIIRNIIKL